MHMLMLVPTWLGYIPRQCYNHVAQSQQAAVDVHSLLEGCACHTTALDTLRASQVNEVEPALHNCCADLS